jgi:hypothetical protein
MDNTFSSTYAAWPLRFFGLLPNPEGAHSGGGGGDSPGTLAFIGQPDSTTHLYDIDEAERWLTSLDLE